MAMPRPRLRRSAVLVALVVALLAGSVSAIRYGLPFKRHLEVQGQLAAFRADPSQANATRLAREIITGRASKEDAEEIARAWLDPKIVTRRSYRPGEPIDFTLVSGNETALMTMRPGPDGDPQSGKPALVCLESEFHTTLHVPGLTPDEGIKDSRSVRFGLNFLAKTFAPSLDFGWESPLSGAPLVISKPGVYRGTLTFAGAATTTFPFFDPPPDLLDAVLMRLRLKSRPNIFLPGYHFAIQLPVEIRVEEGAAGDEVSPAAAAQILAGIPEPKKPLGIWPMGIELAPRIQPSPYIALVAFRSAYHPSRQEGFPAEPGTQTMPIVNNDNLADVCIEGEFTLVEKLHLDPPPMGCVSDSIRVQTRWGGDEADRRTVRLNRFRVGDDTPRLFLVVQGDKKKGLLGSWFFGPIPPDEAPDLREFVDYLLAHPFYEISESEAQALVARPNVWLCRLGLGRLDRTRSVRIKPYFAAMRHLPAGKVADLMENLLGSSSSFSAEAREEFVRELSDYVNSADPEHQVAVLDCIIHETQANHAGLLPILGTSGILAKTLARQIESRTGGKEWADAVKDYRKLLATLKAEAP